MIEGLTSVFHGPAGTVEAWKVWIVFGIAGFSFALAVCVVWIIGMHRRFILLAESTLRKTEGAVNGLNQSVTGLGRRIMDVEGQVQSFSIQQELGGAQGVAGNSPQFYKQASLLAEKGASVDELVDSCGVSVAEAELITYLYKKDVSSAD